MGKYFGFVMGVLLCSIVLFPGLSFSSGLSLQKTFTHDLDQCRDLIVAVKHHIEIGQNNESNLDQLQKQIDKVRASYFLLKKEFEKRAETLRGNAASRHAAVEKSFEQFAQKFFGLCENLLSAPDLKTAQELLDLIDQAITRKNKKIIGNTPYRHLGYAAKTPVLAPEVTPSYKTDSTSFGQSDLDSTPETEISEAVALLAESLNWSPVKIYEWVKNNIKTEWYWGSMKGAEETLAQKSGNDFDQASLLIALLRASGYPSRYVQGVIGFFPDIERAKNLTGVKDSDELAVFFQKAGVPYEAVSDEGQAINYQIEHIWVETLVPWTNYKGVPIENAGKSWIALDTSVKVFDFTETSPLDLPDASVFTGLRDKYLAGRYPETPLAFLQSEISAALQGTGSTYDELLLKRGSGQEVMNVLPAGLQFKTIAITNEFVMAPDELKHKVRFHAVDEEGSMIFEDTVNVSEISNAEVALVYEPVTIEDQELINSYYCMENTPSYLIRVRPVLEIDDRRVMVGQAGFAPGETFSLTLELISPSGTVSVTNSHTVGSMSVIGIVAGNAVFHEVPEDIEKDLRYVLHGSVAGYVHNWNEAEIELASLLRTSLIRPVPTIVTMGGMVEVEWLLGVPHGTTWKGAFVDADLRAVEITGGFDFGSDADSQKLFVCLSSLQGSVLEGQILNDTFDVGGVSTASAIQWANDNGITIETIDAGNLDIKLSELTLPDYIETDIQNAVDVGCTVTIPGQSLTIEDWTGYAYIKENAGTGESGWMLSGMIAGGMTAYSPERWDQGYVDLFTLILLPNTDPEAAWEIYKIKVSDLQDGTAGESLGEHLQVVVLDYLGNRVQGAPVTFSTVSGGGHFDGKDPGTDIVVETDAGGIARIRYFLGECTDTCAGYPDGNPVARKRDSDTEDDNPHVVGENIITAALANGTALTMPFTEYGFPGNAAIIKKMMGDEQSGVVNSAVGSLVVYVTDQYGNSISNAMVDFTVLEPQKGSAREKDLPGDLINLKLYEYDSCPLIYPLREDCTTSESLTIKTDSDGAQVNAILGDTVATDYRVQVSTAGASSEIFNLSSRGYIAEGEYPPEAPMLFMKAMNSINIEGGSVLASKAGTAVAKPLQVCLFLNSFAFHMVATEDGYMPISDDKVVTTKVSNATVTFETLEGAGTPGEVTSPQTSYYETIYTTGTEPDLEKIRATAVADISVPMIDYGKDDYPEEMPYRTVTMEAGKSVYFDDGTPIFDGEVDDHVFECYALDYENDSQQILYLDDDGYLKCDTKVIFTLNPAGYKPTGAAVDIYKHVEGEDSRLIASVLTRNVNGDFDITLAKGFYFETSDPEDSTAPAIEYQAQLVMNRNTELEIVSEPVRLVPSQTKIISLEVEDDVVPIPVGETAKMIANTKPAGRRVEWAIMYRPEGVLATIDKNTGRIKVDKKSENGFIKVRATDAQIECVYKEAMVFIGCMSCQLGVCVAEGSGFVNLSSIDARFSLGKSEGGMSAGDLFIKSESMSTDLATPRALVFSTLARGTEALFDEDEVLHQVVTPKTFVNIVELDDFSYEIRYYRPEDMGARDGDFYTVNEAAEPFSLWRVENPDKSLEVYNRLTISEIDGTEIKTYEYIRDEDSGEWSLGKDGGNQITTKQEFTDSETGNAIEIETVKDSGGLIASVRKTVKQAFAWGDEIVQAIDDPEGEALATSTTWHTDPEVVGSYTNIHTINRPDGSMVTFTYDENGRTLTEVRNWLDDGDGRMVTYDYTPVDPLDLNDTEDEYNPRKVTESIDGIIVSKIFYAYMRLETGERIEITEQCQNSDAVYGDTSNLRTTRTRYPSGNETIEKGRLKTIQYPDGRLDTFTYERGNFRGTDDEERVIVTHGTIDNPEGIAQKTLREVTVSSPLGNTIYQGSYLYTGAGYEEISYSTMVYDEFDRLIETNHSNGTKTTAVWGCCSKESETDATGMTTQYTYDGLKRLESAVREGLNGEIRTTYTYDAAGRRLTQTTTGGSLVLETGTSYDTVGRVKSSTDASGLVTNYEYGATGLVTTIERPGGIRETTTLYKDGQTKSITGSGVVSRYYTYGVEANGDTWVEVHTGAESSPMWQKTWTDMLGRTVKVENSGYAGTETALNTYNDKGYLVGTSVTGQPDTLFDYDEDTGIQYRSGLDVDGNGELVPASMDRITDSLVSYMEDGDIWYQQTENIVYALADGETPTVTSRSRQQLTGLGADGKTSESLTEDVYGNSTVSRTFVDADNNRVASVTDVPDSTIDVTVVNEYGLTVSSTDKSNVTTTFLYDELGRRTGVIDPRTGETVTNYDETGRVDTITDPVGNITRFTYDPSTGRKIAQENASGKITRYAYNDQGQVIRTWGDDTYPVAYDYDSYGRMVTMTTYRSDHGWSSESWPETATDGDVTTWQYHEASGLLEYKVDADSNQVAYTYHPGGRLYTRTWARTPEGAPLITTYDYDDTGELHLIDYSDGTPDIIFEYDRLGRQVAVEDAMGTRVFSYDDTDLHLESETLQGLTSSGSVILTRIYEMAGETVPGRPKGFTLGSDHSVTYGYDASGRFSTLSWNTSSQTGSASYGYVTDSSLLKSRTTINTNVTFGYESRRNLITSVENRYDSDVVSRYDYVYDALGRRTSVQISGNAFAQSAFNLYGYNDRNELTNSDRYQGRDTTDLSLPVEPEKRIYHYDPIGNRNSVTEGADETTYSSNTLNQYSSIGTEAPVYDDDGNLRTYKDKIYTYNAENRLIAFEPASPVEGNQKLEFVYDYLGRRVKKTVYAYASGAWDTGTTTLFVYDGWNLIRELDEEGSVQKDYVWGLDLSQSLQGAGGIGGLVAAVDGGTQYIYFYDGNGNVGQVVDSADGSMDARYEYDPFGKALVAVGEYADENTFRFSTKFFDGVSGLYYYGYRYYSPNLGRWINRDPMNEIGYQKFIKENKNLDEKVIGKRYVDYSHDINISEWNLYLFLSGNPVKYFDAFGLEAWAFTKLKTNYQTRDDMLKGKTFKPDWALGFIQKASCATRLSNAFNRAGYSLLDDAHKEGVYQTVKDQCNKYYIISAHKLALHIEMAKSKYRIKNLKSIEGKQGLIYFENFHIDLWDDKKMVGNRDGHLHNPDYETIPSNNKDRAIYFMELK